MSNSIFSLQDYELLWNHVPWILEKDQELGVKVGNLKYFVFQCFQDLAPFSAFNKRLPVAYTRTVLYLLKAGRPSVVRF